MEQQQDGELGPIGRAAIETAPGMMRELTEQFIARRDLNSRVRIRLRMKALLDLIGVDTEYPHVPALNPGQERRGAGPEVGVGDYLAAPDARMQMDGNPVPAPLRDGQGVALVPGAQQHGLDNDVILGG